MSKRKTRRPRPPVRLKLAVPQTPPTPDDALRAALYELRRPRRRYVWIERRDERQHRRIGKRHALPVASLVGLLELDVERDEDTAPKIRSSTASVGFASRAPGQYAPRELMHAFTHELSIWLAALGIDEYGDPHTNLGNLALAVPYLTKHADAVPRFAGELVALTRAAEHWVSQLRRYIGLEAAFTLQVPCPQCAEVGTVTVVLDMEHRRSESARCSRCKHNWNPLTVNQLVMHVKGLTA